MYLFVVHLTYTVPYCMYRYSTVVQPALSTLYIATYGTVVMYQVQYVDYSIHSGQGRAQQYSTCKCYATYRGVRILYLQYW
jgi:hypothetical protein